MESMVEEIIKNSNSRFLSQKFSLLPKAYWNKKGIWKKSLFYIKCKNL